MIQEIVVSGALAAAVTFIVPLITRWNWPRWAKVTVTIVLTAVVTAAVLIGYFKPDTWEQIVAFCGFAFGVGQAVFQLLKPTGVFDWLEDKTTPASAAAPRRAVEEYTG